MSQNLLSAAVMIGALRVKGLHDLLNNEHDHPFGTRKGLGFLLMGPHR